MEIEVLFEDENVAVVNKPAGLVVHSDGKIEEPTLVDWILKYYPELGGVGEDMFVRGKGGEEVHIRRPGIVHRIDRDTTGVLVIAKTPEAFQHLKQQFQNREVEKRYLALVYGWPKREGVIDAPIGRNAKDFRMRQVAPYARGQLRDARTEYRTLAYYEDPRITRKRFPGEGRYALVEARPKTGRTHQIRVHLKSIGHPIVADSLYRGRKKKETLGFERTALHALEIRFRGVHGEDIRVRTPLPEDFLRVQSTLTQIEG